jgi:hypothetical protein
MAVKRPPGRPSTRKIYVARSYRFDVPTYDLLKSFSTAAGLPEITTLVLALHTLCRQLPWMVQDHPDKNKRKEIKSHRWVRKTKPHTSATLQDDEWGVDLDPGDPRISGEMLKQS